jgi:hypothetical protein
VSKSTRAPGWVMMPIAHKHRPVRHDGHALWRGCFGKLHEIERTFGAGQISIHPVELILLLTASAAGAVDVISFTTLGGAFASAMTGNFALLAYYVAQSNSQAAMGSVVALSGFVILHH